MIIGITGHIGSGKTTIVQWFEQAGYTKLDVDAISHELLKDQEIRTKITAAFGEGILDRKLQVDRKKLSSIVFNNPQQLHRLNNIVHQKLRQSILDVLKDMKKKHDKIIMDVALLEELRLVSYVDKIILVKANLEVLYRRLAPRYTQREVLTAINNQKIPSHTDIILENNGSLEDLEQKMQKVISDLR